jgi:hypothetical protein
MGSGNNYIFNVSDNITIVITGYFAMTFPNGNGNAANAIRLTINNVSGASIFRVDGYVVVSGTRGNSHTVESAFLNINERVTFNANGDVNVTTTTAIIGSPYCEAYSNSAFMVSNFGRVNVSGTLNVNNRLINDGGGILNIASTGVVNVNAVGPNFANAATQPLVHIDSYNSNDDNRSGGIINVLGELNVNGWLRATGCNNTVTYASNRGQLNIGSTGVANINGNATFAVKDNSPNFGGQLTLDYGGLFYCPYTDAARTVTMEGNGPANYINGRFIIGDTLSANPHGKAVLSRPVYIGVRGDFSGNITTTTTCTHSGTSNAPTYEYSANSGGAYIPSTENQAAPNTVNGRHRRTTLYPAEVCCFVGCTDNGSDITEVKVRPSYNAGGYQGWQWRAWDAAQTTTNTTPSNTRPGYVTYGTPHTHTTTTSITGPKGLLWARCDSIIGTGFMQVGSATNHEAEILVEKNTYFLNRSQGAPLSPGMMWNQTNLWTNSNKGAATALDYTEYYKRAVGFPIYGKITVKDNAKFLKSNPYNGETTAEIARYVQFYDLYSGSAVNVSNSGIFGTIAESYDITGAGEYTGLAPVVLRNNGTVTIKDDAKFFIDYLHRVHNGFIEESITGSNGTEGTITLTNNAVLEQAYRLGCTPFSNGVTVTTDNTTLYSKKGFAEHISAMTATTFVNGYEPGSKGTLNVEGSAKVNIGSLGNGGGNGARRTGTTYATAVAEGEVNIKDNAEMTLWYAFFNAGAHGLQLNSPTDNIEGKPRLNITYDQNLFSNREKGTLNISDNGLLSIVHPAELPTTSANATVNYVLQHSPDAVFFNGWSHGGAPNYVPTPSIDPELTNSMAIVNVTDDGKLIVKNFVNGGQAFTSSRFRYTLGADATDFVTTTQCNAADAFAIVNLTSDNASIHILNNWDNNAQYEANQSTATAEMGAKNNSGILNITAGILTIDGNLTNGVTQNRPNSCDLNRAAEIYVNGTGKIIMRGNVINNYDAAGDNNHNHRYFYIGNDATGGGKLILSPIITDTINLEPWKEIYVFRNGSIIVDENKVLKVLGTSKHPSRPDLFGGLFFDANTLETESYRLADVNINNVEGALCLLEGAKFLLSNDVAEGFGVNGSNDVAGVLITNNQDNGSYYKSNMYLHRGTYGDPSDLPSECIFNGQQHLFLTDERHPYGLVTLEENFGVTMKDTVVKKYLHTFTYNYTYTHNTAAATCQIQGSTATGNHTHNASIVRIVGPDDNATMALPATPEYNFAFMNKNTATTAYTSTAGNYNTPNALPTQASTQTETVTMNRVACQFGCTQQGHNITTTRARISNRVGTGWEWSDWGQLTTTIGTDNGGYITFGASHMHPANEGTHGAVHAQVDVHQTVVDGQQDINEWFAGDLGGAGALEKLKQWIPDTLFVGGEADVALALKKTNPDFYDYGSRELDPSNPTELLHPRKVVFVSSYTNNLRNDEKEIFGTVERRTIYEDDNITPYFARYSVAVGGALSGKDVYATANGVAYAFNNGFTKLTFDDAMLNIPSFKLSIVPGVEPVVLFSSELPRIAKRKIIAEFTLRDSSNPAAYLTNIELGAIGSTLEVSAINEVEISSDLNVEPKLRIGESSIADVGLKRLASVATPRPTLVTDPKLNGYLNRESDLSILLVPAEFNEDDPDHEGTRGFPGYFHSGNYLVLGYIPVENIRSGRWSDRMTWLGQEIPRAEDSVTIIPGTIVYTGYQGNVTGLSPSEKIFNKRVFGAGITYTGDPKVDPLDPNWENPTIDKTRTTGMNEDSILTRFPAPEWCYPVTGDSLIGMGVTDANSGDVAIQLCEHIEIMEDAGLVFGFALNDPGANSAVKAFVVNSIDNYAYGSEDMVDATHFYSDSLSARNIRGLQIMTGATKLVVRDVLNNYGKVYNSGDLFAGMVVNDRNGNVDSVLFLQENAGAKLETKRFVNSKTENGVTNMLDGEMDINVLQNGIEAATSANATFIQTGGVVKIIDSLYSYTATSFDTMGIAGGIFVMTNTDSRTGILAKHPITLTNTGHFIVDAKTKVDMSGDAGIVLEAGSAVSNLPLTDYVSKPSSIDDVQAAFAMLEGSELNIKEAGGILHNDADLNNVYFHRGEYKETGQTDMPSKLIYSGSADVIPTRASHPLGILELAELWSGTMPDSLHIAGEVSPALVYSRGSNLDLGTKSISFIDSVSAAAYTGAGATSEIIGMLSRVNRDFGYATADGWNYTFNNAATVLSFEDAKEHLDSFSLTIHPNTPPVKVQDPTQYAQRKIEIGFQTSGDAPLPSIMSLNIGYRDIASMNEIPDSFKVKSLFFGEGFNDTRKHQNTAPASPTGVVSGFSQYRNDDMNLQLLVSTLPNVAGNVSEFINDNELVLAVKPTRFISVRGGRWSDYMTWDQQERPGVYDTAVVSGNHIVYTGSQSVSFGGRPYGPLATAMGTGYENGPNENELIDNLISDNKWKLAEYVLIEEGGCLLMGADIISNPGINQITDTLVFGIVVDSSRAARPYTNANSTYIFGTTRDTTLMGFQVMNGGAKVQLLGGSNNISFQGFGYTYLNDTVIADKDIYNGKYMNLVGGQLHSKGTFYNGGAMNTDLPANEDLAIDTIYLDGAEIITEGVFINGYTASGVLLQNEGRFIAKDNVTAADNSETNLFNIKGGQFIIDNDSKKTIQTDSSILVSDDGQFIVNVNSSAELLGDNGIILDASSQISTTHYNIAEGSLYIDNIGLDVVTGAFAMLNGSRLEVGNAVGIVNNVSSMDNVYFHRGVYNSGSNTPATVSYKGISPIFETAKTHPYGRLELASDWLGDVAMEMYVGGEADDAFNYLVDGNLDLYTLGNSFLSFVSSNSNPSFNGTNNELVGVVKRETVIDGIPTPQKLFGDATLASNKPYIFNNKWTILEFSEAGEHLNEFSLTVFPTSVPLADADGLDPDYSTDAFGQRRIIVEFDADGVEKPTISNLRVGYIDEAEVSNSLAALYNNADTPLSFGDAKLPNAKPRSLAKVTGNGGGYTANALKQYTATDVNIELSGNFANGDELVLFAASILKYVSVKNGRWSDPETWQALRVPSRFDSVFVRHIVYTGLYDGTGLFGGRAWDDNESEIDVTAGEAYLAAKVFIVPQDFDFTDLDGYEDVENLITNGPAALVIGATDPNMNFGIPLVFGGDDLSSGDISGIDNRVGSATNIFAVSEIPVSSSAQILELAKTTDGWNILNGLYIFYKDKVSGSYGAAEIPEPVIRVLNMLNTGLIQNGAVIDIGR